jgi:hypothetical protein
MIHPTAQILKDDKTEIRIVGASIPAITVLTKQK